MKRTLIALSLLSLCATASAEPLAAWNEGAAKSAIIEWVTNATQSDRSTYIPPEKRYVVFDNDGTLWPEAPLTFQIQFALDEIKRLAPEHPDWANDPLVKAVLADDIKSVAAAGEKGLMQLLSLTHSGMTTEVFDQRVANWITSHNDRRFGCRYDQMGYQPMRQLLDYLRENGFKTWIISGGGIDFMRVLSEKMYGIPPEQVVGSFSLGEFKASDDHTQITKTMQGAFNDDAANKPVAIHLFMGQHPVAAFGNSDGDLAMMQYTAANPDYKTFGLLVHHTDAAREYAYDSHPPASGKLIEGLKVAKEKGWTVVNMQQDWKTVFDPAQCAVRPTH
ncbi:haloacid dehalogenase-like hydrolase [Salmonella enterica subsp. enterica serovar Oslo]|nr:haloacid dehalogenase-like hydrolase [Salmonella enterica]EBB9036826.1 haloacid dehalogenase-like hydrolase [Salmonella enterica subsp. enterica serovar Oslo]ECD0768205.1 haloacid dehalogenase-like hydrolase [Salmonella enterica subsp. enterica serovar Papuana]EAN4769830.1 haloacid dehalogenase-like hydrolase [Salmonella enterica]EAS5669512.1 haloacid dehalogenase-like hydrolase [Salmonella enterica]